MAKQAELTSAIAATDAEQALIRRLLERYGPMVGGRDLQLLLGFKTAAALRQASMRSTIPVPVFQLPNRRGRFALTEEVAAWLVKCRRTAQSDPKSGALSHVSQG